MPDTMSVTTPTMNQLEVLLDAVGTAVNGSGMFGDVTRRAGVMEAAAKQCPDDAAFRIEAGSDGIYVAWVTPDRYMSQSIEADLMWTGDDLADMIEEELADVGWTHGHLGKLEHFRNDEKLFTFRSRVPLDTANVSPDRDAATLLKCLLAYEAAFRELGDMKPEEEE